MNEQFTKEEVEKYLIDLQKDITAWSEVQRTLDSAGWKNHIEPMLRNMMSSLNSLEGVNSLEELQVRKQVITAIQTIFKAFDVFEGKAISAKVDADTMQKYQQAIA